mgnify:CR=1 FL=1
MNKLIGVVGVMGTGKTTLCAESGCEFIKTDVSGIYKKRGLDPKEAMSLDTRLDVQEEILEYHCQLWLKACVRGNQDGKRFVSENKVLVTDRTPLCFMTFTLCEISGYDKLTEAQDMRLKGYIHRCWIAMTMFKGIMYLGQSFTPPVDLSEKIRASMSYGYREHHDNVQKGLVSSITTGTPVARCLTSDKVIRKMMLGKLADNC